MSGRIELHELSSGWRLRDEDENTINLASNPLQQAMDLSAANQRPLDVAGDSLTLTTGITVPSISGLSWNIEVGEINFPASAYTLFFSNALHCYIDFRSTLKSSATTGGFVTFSPQSGGDTILDSTFHFHRILTSGSLAHTPVYMTSYNGAIQRNVFDFGEVESAPDNGLGSANYLMQITGPNFTFNKITIDQGLCWAVAAVSELATTINGNNIFDLGLKAIGEPDYGFKSYGDNNIIFLRLDGSGVGTGLRLAGDNNTVIQGKNEASTPVQDLGTGNTFV